MNSPYLSLIVPVYNEQKRLAKGLEAILNYLQKQKYKWEIVLVNDGSIDKTVKVAKKIFQGQKNCLILNHETNLGKGAGVRYGIKMAQGR